MEHEPTLQSPSTKPHFQTQFYKQWVQQLTFPLLPGWSFMLVCPLALVLVQLVKHSELNDSERSTRALRTVELEHTWECFLRHQCWLNRVPASTAHSDSHTAHRPVDIWKSMQIVIMETISATHTKISHPPHIIFFNSGPFREPNSFCGPKAFMLITLLRNYELGERRRGWHLFIHLRKNDMRLRAQENEPTII